MARYRIRNRITGGSITLREFEREDLKRTQKIAKFAKERETRIYDKFCDLRVLLSFFRKMWYEVDFRWNTVFVRDFSYFWITVNSPEYLHKWILPEYDNLLSDDLFMCLIEIDMSLLTCNNTLHTVYERIIMYYTLHIGIIFHIHLI